MILAIESSCDESALALFDPSIGFTGEWVHSQIDLHKEYGGVVPDLATREHLLNFPHLLRKAKEALGDTKPTHIAVTQGPGLAGCLAIGISLSKALSLYYKAPLISVNHLRAHALSPFVRVFELSPKLFEENFKNIFPHLGLVVSGGNTILFRINAQLEIQILAETVDDAAGEAIDKGAKLLGLPYPGGPEMEKLSTNGNPKWYKFPVAFPNSDDHRFSFSGLKTSLRYLLEKMSDKEVNKHIADICASYQQAVIDQLARKTKQLLKAGDYQSIGLSGGVANNSLLRDTIENLAESNNIPVFMAKKSHTGDNAGMIAFSAFIDQRLQIQESVPPIKMSFLPNWRLN